MLGWSRAEAAKICQVGINTLARLEMDERHPRDRTMDHIVRIFSEHGVTFFENGGGAGVFFNPGGGGIGLPSP